MKKRLLATVLTLCMALTLPTATALAASGDVYVGGILLEDNQYLENGATAVSAVKPDSGGYAYYYNGVLTLNNAVVAGDATGASDKELAGIYAEGDLEIILEGSSTVTGQDATDSYGVYALENLYISGTGSLTASGGGGDCSYGLYSDYFNITISSGNVTAKGGTAADVSCGIYAFENIVINGGTITALGGEADISYGLCACEDVVILGGEVIARGGSGGDESYGIYSEDADIDISGGQVDATGGTANGATGDSIGICAEDGDINISRGQVEATGGQAAGSSYGIYSYYSNVNITGGEIQANGGQADDSVGICACDNLVIEGGSVTAIGSAADAGYGYGLWTEYGNVVIRGGQVTANGGLTGSQSYGIFTGVGDVVLCGQTLSLNGTENSIYTPRTLAYQDGLLPDISDVDASVIIKWTPSGDKTPYPVKTNGDLAVDKGTVDVWWDSISGQSGISYGDISDMENADFLPFPEALVVGSVFVGGIELESGEYLPNGSSSVTLAEPAGGDVYYNNGVLTLHDAQIAAPLDTSGILTEYDLSITLEGTNRVAPGNGQYICGIFALGDINISGSGRLHVIGGKFLDTVGGGLNMTGDSLALYSYYGSVTVNSGEITAEGDASNGSGFGIYARRDININGGKVNAIGGTLVQGVIGSYGIYSEEGNLNITDGIVTATGGQVYGISCGIYANDVNISGGTTKATGGQANNRSYGICAWYDLNISGGQVTADSGDNCLYDSHGIFAEEKISISDGTVNTTGGNNAGVYSSGIHSETETIQISGGRIQALGGTGSGYSHGIHAAGDLEVSGSAKVTALGGDSCNTSYGIMSYGNFSATEQTEVMAKGGTACELNSLGLDVYDGILISDSARVSAVSGSAPWDYGSSYAIRTMDRITVNGGILDAVSGAARNSMGLSVTNGAFFNGGQVSIRGEELALRVFGGGFHLANELTIQGASSSRGTLGPAATHTDSDNFITIHLGSDASGAMAKYVSIALPDSHPKASSPGVSYSYYTITAKAGAGGKISFDGATSVRQGENRAVTITPDEGYIILDVLVDGVSVGAVSEYTFEKVGEGHTVEAIFGWDNPFDDVSPEDWFYENVRYVYEQGLMVGTAEDAFSPGLPATRAMVVTILWRLEGSPLLADYDSGFTDLTQDWYIDAVNWAHENGIVDGYDETHFGPGDSITREQLVTILWRYAASKGLDVSLGEDANPLSYYDSSDVSKWAVDAFQWACGAGIVQGDNGNLLPAGDATRAQLAAILQRFVEWTEK